MTTVMIYDLRHEKQNQCDLIWVTYKTSWNTYFQAIWETNIESVIIFVKNCYGKDIFKGLNYSKNPIIILKKHL
jgi:hypothetical protein